MFNTLKAVSRSSYLINRGISTSLAHKSAFNSTFSVPIHKNFGSFFKRNTEESSNKKKGIFDAAKDALLDGFFKESDYRAVEQSNVRNRIKSYEEEAEEHYQQLNYTKALSNYKIARNLVRDHYEENYQELAYYTGRIGDTYYELEEWDHAINSYKENLEMLKGKLLGKSEEKGRSMFRIGMCYFRENNYAEAITHMKDTKEFYLKNSKSESRESVIASCSQILAECYIGLGHYEKALQHTEKSINILSKNKNVKKTDLALTQNYLNYGLALAYADKDFNTSLQYMREHQNAQLKKNGEDSFSAGMNYLRIGEVYSLQGRFPKALNNFEKALKIFEEKVGSHDRRTGMCHKAIGYVYAMQEDYNACIEHTEKALACFQKSDPELSEAYKNIAFAYSAMMEHEKALKNLKLSVETREKALEGLEEEDLQYMVLNGFLADACYKKEEYAQATVHNEALLKELCRFIANECKCA